MAATTEAPRPTKVAKRKSPPEFLIKEWVMGIPVYYKGYREVWNNRKKLEDIMADGMLQAIIKNWLHLFLGQHLNLSKYWILAGEIGSHLAHRKNASHDLVIIEKALLPPSKVSNHYADVPPKVVIEIDTEVEFGDTPRSMEEFVHRKTQQTLDFGTEKVIWIFTSSRKILVATPNADWTISDWNKNIEVLDGVQFNLAEYIAQEGIGLAPPEA